MEPQNVAFISIDVDINFIRLRFLWFYPVI